MNPLSIPLYTSFRIIRTKEYRKTKNNPLYCLPAAGPHGWEVFDAFFDIACL